VEDILRRKIELLLDNTRFEVDRTEAEVAREADHLEMLRDRLANSKALVAACEKALAES
jgi:hypothetical protein